MNFCKINILLLSCSFFSISAMESQAAAQITPSSDKAAILSPSIKTTIDMRYPTILRYTKDGTLLAGTSNYALFVCHPYAQDPSKRFDKITVTDFVSTMDTDPMYNNLMAMQDADPLISIYDIETRVKVSDIPNQSGSCTLKYNNDGRQLLIARFQEGCALADTQSKDIRVLTSDPTVNGAYYNPADNNSVVSWSNEQNGPSTFTWYDIRRNGRVKTLVAKSTINNLAFNSDGSRIVASCTGDFELLDAKTAALIEYLNIKGKKTDGPRQNKNLIAANIAFMPKQNTFLASLWNGRFVISDLDQPGYHGTFEIPANPRYPDFYPFAISDDGNDMAVSLTENMQLKIYDVSGLKEQLREKKSQKDKVNQSNPLFDTEKDLVARQVAFEQSLGLAPADGRAPASAGRCSLL